MNTDRESMSTGMTPKAQKRALGIVFFILLMDIVGLSILAPVAPYIVRKYSSEAFTVTMLSVIYAAAQFIAAPFLGKISDRVGRRPVLLACVFGSAIGYFVFGIAGALWVLFLARLIDGLTGGNLSSASAYIVDVSKPEERARNMTIIGMAFGLGFILGPALGGALGQISLDAPVLAAGVLSLINVALIFFLLPESLPVERRDNAPLRLRDLNPLVSIADMMRKPGLGIVLAAYFLFVLALNGTNSTAGVFVMQRFAAQPWQAGLFFVIAGLATALVQGALVGRLVPRFGEKRVTSAGLMGTAAGALLVFVAPVFWLLYPLGFLQSAASGFLWSTLGTLAANRVSWREPGQLAGVNAALGGLAAVVGPLGAGLAYDHVMMGSPYWIGALILVMACGLIARVKESPALAAVPAESGA